MLMKKLLVVVAILFIGPSVIACPVCERQQPEILKGIAHGSGPQNNWDYLIISVAALIVLVTLFYSIKWLVRPGEKSLTHIKHSVLNNQ